VNVEAEVAVPPGEVMLMVPVVPLPTVALIELDDMIVKVAAGVPPKLTEAMFARFVPFMLTTVPAGPDDGEKDVSVGASGVW
jgi:hypothetical protein